MTPSEPGSSDFVTRLSDAFARLAGACFDHRWLVLVVFLALVAGAAVLAGSARIDNSYENYFDPSDTSYRAYERYREDFGSDELSYVLYEAPGREHGVFDLEVMRKIAALSEAIEREVPFVYEVDSLATAELVRGVEGGIEIRRLVDDFPESQAELLALRAHYLAKPMLVGGLVSEDGRHGALVIEMDRSSTDPLEQIRVDPEGGDALENLYPQATEAGIAALLASPEYADLVFHHSGDVPLNALYNRIIGGESASLQLVTAAIIGLILALCFRSWVGTLAPLLVVQISVVGTVALIAALGWKLDLSFGSAPTLLTAIGVAHAVHILSEFGGRFRALRDRRAALVETLRLVGTPCLLTSLTTATGFASMSFVPIKSIAHSGVYNAFGVLAAFVVSLTLLMALLSFGRREPREAVATPVPERRRLRAGLAAVAAFDQRHRRAILAGFGLVFALALAGALQVVPDSNWLDDFRDSTPLKQETIEIDRVMGGTTNLIYLFDAGEAEGIQDPAVLREMERLQGFADEHGGIIRKTYSIVDVLKDLNQAFHEGDPAWYRLPESRALVAQYLLLYEMSGGEQAEEFVSADYRRASVELRLALGPVSETEEVVEAIGRELAARPLEASSLELTGIGALWLKLMDYIVSSQIQGFLLAFVVIALMMIAIFRSPSLGLLSMVPNLAPPLVALGVMGWLDIPLDYSKISIAGVAIGIAVDDTIHLVSRYRFEFLRYGSYARALEAALLDVGRALLITSLALVAGFLVFLGSSLASQATYGILLSATIVTALVADFLLMPALILTFHPFGPEGRGRSLEPEVQEAA